MDGTASRLAFLAAVLVAMAPAIARAQGPQATGDPRTPLGAYVLLGAGVTDFTAPDVRSRVTPGGAVEVRVGIGSRSFLGLEAAYVGSIRGGAPREHDVVMHGGEGVVRLQAPHVERGTLVEPFAFVGLGYASLSVGGRPSGAGRDDLGVVPLGAGLTVGSGRLLFDARVTYRSTFGEDVSLSGSRRARPSFDQWALSAAVGVEF